jgi:hypothetical protein
VLGHPKIHNIFLDDDWDGHNPDAPTSAQIDVPRCACVEPLPDAAAQRCPPGRVHGLSRPQPLRAPIQPHSTTPNWRSSTPGSRARSASVLPCRD